MHGDASEILGCAAELRVNANAMLRVRLPNQRLSCPSPSARCCLAHLTIRSCHIRDEGLATLCRGARFNRHLTSLAIVDPGLGPNSLGPLVELLEQNATMTHLTTSAVPITPLTFSRFAGALASNGTVSHVALDRNGLGDEHVAPLLTCIREMLCLHTLSLKHNKLGPLAA